MQIETAKRTCEHLDGLVMMGATHTVTDVATLANYFTEQGVKTKVVGSLYLRWKYTLLKEPAVV